MGASQAFWITPQLGQAGCAYPYWLGIGKVRVCDPIAGLGCTVVIEPVSCSGTLWGDQTECCGWECGKGSRCIGASGPLQFIQGKCVVWQGVLRSADGWSQALRYFTASLRFRMGPCEGGTLIYETASLGTTTNPFGEFMLSWSISSDLWNALLPYKNTNVIMWLDIKTVG